MNRILVVIFGLGCQLLPGCSAAEPDTTGAALAAPVAADFPKVAEALQLRCATLDCHGQAGRNLRLYGAGGLRLSPEREAAFSAGSIPPKAPTPLSDFSLDETTEAELAASYASIVGLEPEPLSQVSAGQADPNQLALVRKTRGIERHKGGKLANVGDALDLCIVRWLTRAYDAKSCSDVIDAPRPDPIQIQ